MIIDIDTDSDDAAREILIGDYIRVDQCCYRCVEDDRDDCGSCPLKGRAGCRYVLCAGNCRSDGVSTTFRVAPAAEVRKAAAGDMLRMQHVRSGLQELKALVAELAGRIARLCTVLEGQPTADEACIQKQRRKK